MKKQIYAITLSVVALTLFSQAHAQMNVDGINQIDEDQTIICVNNSDGIENNGFTCHLYQIDKLDWYQDAFDGTLFNQDDSFDIRVVD